LSVSFWKPSLKNYTERQGFCTETLKNRKMQEQQQTQPSQKKKKKRCCCKIVIAFVFAGLAVAFSLGLYQLEMDHQMAASFTQGHCTFSNGSAWKDETGFASVLHRVCLQNVTASPDVECFVLGDQTLNLTVGPETNPVQLCYPPPGRLTSTQQETEEFVLSLGTATQIACLYNAKEGKAYASGLDHRGARLAMLIVGIDGMLFAVGFMVYHS
jgi:hypothetical protein